MSRGQLWNKDPMKKEVHAPSIHGGVFVGVGLLWPQTPS
jgi:hypothetical protein